MIRRFQLATLLGMLGLACSSESAPKAAALAGQAAAGAGQQLIVAKSPAAPQPIPMPYPNVANRAP